MTSLDLSDAVGLTSLAGIEGLSNLQRLGLFNADGLTSLAGIDCARIEIVAPDRLLATCDKN